LIEATVIIAQIERLPPTNSPEDLNLLKFVVNFFSTPSIRPSPRRPTPYYPGSKKSLYNYNYNTDTGIQVQEEGYLNNMGTDQEILEARGSYNYIDNDGNTFQVSYVANEDGFQPEGAHLPTIPPLIRKALQYITEHPEENEKK